MSKANVPRFGNWESEDNVPYTVYFDKARKTRGGKVINPNDPQENPEMFESVESSPIAPANAHVPPSRPRTRPEEPKGVVKHTPEHGVAREDVGFRQSSDPPARNETVGHKAAGESNYGARRAKATRSPRASIVSEQSFERSPLHPQQQAKVGGRVGGSQGWEGRNYEGNQGTTGKARRPANHGDESPDKAAAVPRFGDWETDPQSAENFTDIFQKVREERNAGPGNVSTTPKHSSYPTRNQPSNQPKGCCWCFGGKTR